MQARDENGNRRLTGGDEFRIELRGAATLYGTVTDLGNGMYQAMYSTTVSGEYLIHVCTGASFRFQILHKQDAVPMSGFECREIG